MGKGVCAKVSRNPLPRIAKNTVITGPQLMQRSEGLPRTNSWAKVKSLGIETKCTLFSNSSHIIWEPMS